MSGARFSSAILPAWSRKSPAGGRGVAAAVPARPVQSATSGRRWSSSSAPTPGLSAATITRLTAQWQDEARAFSDAVAGRHRLRVRVGRRHPPQGPPGAGQGVPAGDDRGPRRRHARSWSRSPTGYRESTESWADLLRDCKRRGMRAPVLAVGDGALGFWKAVREVFPETREQRCWFHKIANVLDALPKSAQPGREGGAGRDLQRRGPATTPRRPRKAFAAEYGAKWPKAVAKITDDLDVLLAFYDYPAEHWIHLRTTNPIESTFATVRLRHAGHQGPRLPGRRRRDGVQAHRVRPGPLARRQRTPPRRPRPRRRHASTTANSSNDPTTRSGRRSASRVNTPIHRS